MERLQKVIASAGVASRRRAEDFVRAGRVCVNGQVVRELGTKVDPERDDIRVDGQRISPGPERVYILLHKPAGYVTTRHDPQGRPTVLDLLQGDAQAGAGRSRSPRTSGPSPIGSVYPVGRLDQPSAGLVLLTNDGEVAYVLAHPRYQVRKVYHVWTQRPVSDTEQCRLLEGIPLEEGIARAVQVRPLSRTKGRGSRTRGRESGQSEIRNPKSEIRNPKSEMGCGLEIVLTEGRKREVRRMLEAMGHTVKRLVRRQIGPLPLGSLRPGQWRYLEPAEVARLQEFVRERKASQQKAIRKLGN
jgi:pseudouridine synthase